MLCFIAKGVMPYSLFGPPFLVSAVPLNPNSFINCTKKSSNITKNYNELYIPDYNFDTDFTTLMQEQHHEHSSTVPDFTDTTTLRHHPNKLLAIKSVHMIANAAETESYRHDSYHKCGIIAHKFEKLFALIQVGRQIRFDTF